MIVVKYYGKHMADVSMVDGQLKVSGPGAKDVEDILDWYRKSLRIAPPGQVADRHSPLVSEQELYDYLPIGMRGTWYAEETEREGKKHGAAS